MHKRHLLLILTIATLFAACKKEKDIPTPDPDIPYAGPYLVFKFRFDSTQQRLNNLGQPSTMDTGHWGQSPKFNLMGAHYFELAPTAWTQLGSGAVLYVGKQTTTGGSDAIDFDSLTLVHEGDVALKIPLKSIATGSYQYLRVSLAYQNYTISFRYSGVDYAGTCASFIGFKTYVRSYHVKDSLVNVNANKVQGYFGFETIYNVTTGDGAGVTTVVNPLASTSPIPAGSCVVTAAFPTALQITGNETSDITVTMNLSTNQSFEWQDLNHDHLWEPTDGENVVDMGIRGMVLGVQ